MGRMLNLENKFVKLSSVPQTTLGLIMTVFLKFVSALTSPWNLDLWYKDFEFSLAPIALTWMNFLTSYWAHIFTTASGIPACIFINFCFLVS